MERSKDWIDEVEGDLEHAKSDAARGYHNWACFSAQQSEERAAKAVFQKLGAEAWGYSVADLLKELSLKAPISEELTNAALQLDKAYVPTRYPNAHPSGSPRTRYTKREAERLIEYAEKNRQVLFESSILNVIKKRLSRHSPGICRMSKRSSLSCSLCCLALMTGEIIP
jgi:HEPN domain-containing protein